MAVDTQTRDQAVSSAVREISHIATLPEITLKIIELVENPDSTAQDLHNVIANDPALCSRILKVVNSAFYGLPGQIGSINRAIVLLGLNAVKNIAIAASLSKLFRGGDLTPNFSARTLWIHSISTAAAAKLIADKLSLGLTDEAFLAGLIHDIGIIVEIQSDRNKLVEVLNKVQVGPDGTPSPTLMEAEQEVYGATHQDFGKGLCEKWKFPQSFIFVTGYHHNPRDLAPEQRTLCNVVALADMLAGGLEGGFRLDRATLVPNDELLADLNLTRGDVDAIIALLPEHVEQVEAMLT